MILQCCHVADLGSDTGKELILSGLVSVCPSSNFLEFAFFIVFYINVFRFLLVSSLLEYNIYFSSWWVIVIVSLSAIRMIFSLLYFLFYAFFFHSMLFYGIAINAILFYFILFCTISLCCQCFIFLILFYSILFYSILFYFLLFYSSHMNRLAYRWDVFRGNIRSRVCSLFFNRFYCRKCRRSKKSEE